MLGKVDIKNNLLFNQVKYMKIDSFNKLVSENNNKRRPWYYGMEGTWWWGKTEEEVRKIIMSEEYRLKVLWIGRNSPEKSPSTMMKIANNLQDIQFIMNIPGGLRNNLYMLGRLSNEEIGNLYNTCDIFCHTAIWPEPAGLTFIEAQMHGKPVIALNRGGVREYTCPEGRMLIDCTDDFAVAEFIKALNILSTDKNRLNEFGEKSRRYTNENFNYKRMGNDYLQLYNNLIS